MTLQIVAAQNVLVHHFGDEAVILNLSNETYYRLNGMAMQMWQALTTSPSVDEAQTALLAEYDVPAEELRNDIDNFIGYLQQAQLVEIRQTETV